MEKLKNNSHQDSIYQFRAQPQGFISLSHSLLLAMTDARSCLERPVSLSGWSINVDAGCPLERLPWFGSNRSSWETVSFLLLQQWPLNCSRRIWRLVEIGGSSLALNSPYYITVWKVIFGSPG